REREQPFPKVAQVPPTNPQAGYRQRSGIGGVPKPGLNRSASSAVDGAKAVSASATPNRPRLGSRRPWPSPTWSTSQVARNFCFAFQKLSPIVLPLVATQAKSPPRQPAILANRRQIR